MTENKDSRQLDTLKTESLLTRAKNDELANSTSTYGMQIKQLETLQKDMNGMLDAIGKDGTLTRDGKVFETAQHMEAFGKNANDTMQRLQHEVDSRINHFQARLFTSNPALSDIEKAMLPVVMESALTEPTKAMAVLPRANIVNSLLHMGLYPDHVAQGVFEGLNRRYSPNEATQIGLWQARNDNLQKIQREVKAYMTTNNYSAKQIERVRANKIAGAGNRMKRVS